MIRKLEHFLTQPNPLIFASRLARTDIPAYRFRIGDYRVIFDWEGGRILITAAGHRREIYRA